MSKLPEAFIALVRSVTIVRLIGGADHIIFNLPGLPSPYPELDTKEPGEYPANFKIEVRRGYGEEWLKLSGYTGLITVVGS